MSGLQTYFEDGYLRRWQLEPPTPTQLAEAVNFLGLAGAGEAALVLDLGCGHGRYAVGMARAGARVIGLDSSYALLRRAIAQTAHLPCEISWVRAKMQAIPFSCMFDVVLAVDAFGYFETDREDVAVLREVHRVLRKGGCLIMRNPNAISIRRDFREHDVERRGGVHTVIQRKFGPDQHTLLEHLTIDDGTGVAEFERQARIYTAAELAAALRAAGLTVDGHYANAMGEPFEAGSSPRIITVGRKAT